MGCDHDGQTNDTPFPINYRNASLIIMAAAGNEVDTVVLSAGLNAAQVVAIGTEGFERLNNFLTISDKEIRFVDQENTTQNNYTFQMLRRNRITVR